MKRTLFNIRLVVLFALSGIILLLNSCNKDVVNPNQTMVGVWEGNIFDSTSGPQPYTLTIKSDGTFSFQALCLGVMHFGQGVWNLNGTSFTAKDTTLYGLYTNVGTVQILKAVYDSKGNTLSAGTYENLAPAYGTGFFSVTKDK